MVKKIIKYDVELLSTKITPQFEMPNAFTNDRNSVEFQFHIMDMTEEQLAEATAHVELSMLDGSYFQNPWMLEDEDGVEQPNVTREGNVFKYTLKENEGNHDGRADIQLVVFIDDVDYASQLYEFKIRSGLETKVAVEVMVHNWTTLTRRAQNYIDQFVKDEADRQALFEVNEGARIEAEDGRIANETVRVASETSRESAEDDRKQNEQTRQAQEATRVSLFADMQLVHDMDTGKRHHVQMEIYGGRPRLKIEEVLS